MWLVGAEMSSKASWRTERVLHLDSRVTQSHSLEPFPHGMGECCSGDETYMAKPRITASYLPGCRYHLSASACFPNQGTYHSLGGRRWGGTT